MNPFLTAILQTLVRNGLLWLAGSLGVQALDSDLSDATSKIVNGLIGAALIAWGLYDKYRSHQKLLTSQAMGQCSAQQVNAVVHIGGAPPLSTPTTEVPQLQ